MRDSNSAPNRRWVSAGFMADCHQACGTAGNRSRHNTHALGSRQRFPRACCFCAVAGASLGCRTSHHYCCLARRQNQCEPRTVAAPGRTGSYQSCDLFPGGPDARAIAGCAGGSRPASRFSRRPWPAPLSSWPWSWRSEERRPVAGHTAGECRRVSNWRNRTRGKSSAAGCRAWTRGQASCGSSAKLLLRKRRAGMDPPASPTSVRRRCSAERSAKARCTPRLGPGPASLLKQLKLQPFHARGRSPSQSGRELAARHNQAATEEVQALGVLREHDAASIATREGGNRTAGSHNLLGHAASEKRTLLLHTKLHPTRETAAVPSAGGIYAWFAGGASLRTHYPGACSPW